MEPVEAAPAHVGSLAGILASLKEQNKKPEPEQAETGGAGAQKKLLSDESPQPVPLPVPPPPPGDMLQPVLPPGDMLDTSDKPTGIVPGLPHVSEEPHEAVFEPRDPAFEGPGYGEMEETRFPPGPPGPHDDYSGGMPPPPHRLIGEGLPGRGGRGGRGGFRGPRGGRPPPGRLPPPPSLLDLQFDEPPRGLPPHARQNQYHE